MGKMRPGPGATVGAGFPSIHTGAVRGPGPVPGSHIKRLQCGRLICGRVHAKFNFNSFYWIYF